MKWLADVLRDHVVEIWRDGRRYIALVSKGSDERQHHAEARSLKSAVQEAVRRCDEDS